jgi:exodeoxyribonuclease V gamma subunit
MLYVHRSERADRLLEVLAEILAEPLGDPLAAEVVAVPTRGVERWLTQRLSHRLGCTTGRSDGVAANIDFPFPGSLVGRAVASAIGLEPEDDPWAPERAVWPLLDLVDEHLGDPSLAPLAEHLKASSPTRDDGALTRFAAVRHIADLYDQYAVHRPEMIRGWANDEDSGLGDRHDWQAVLWRLLRARIGLPSPAERLEAAASRITADGSVVEAPPRLSLFGLTRLPASYLTVLEALGLGRDVHLLLLHPSGALWDSVQQALPAPPARMRRGDDPTAGVPQNPLLRSWGRDAREMQLVLAAHGVAPGEYRPVDEEPRQTLLRRIQSAIRRDQPPPGASAGGLPLSYEPSEGLVDRRPLLAEGDRSIQIHSCHGRYRQVEVLRDAVLHLLSDDDTLELRDVIVMCPDVEAFAPLVQAVLAAEPSTPDGDAASPELRVRLADRSLRQTNPLLAVTSAVLELAEGRLTASQVLDLAGREPVRRRFRFDDDDIAQLERWVIDMGTRWGLDADHRRLWKLGGLETNTWQAGLDRLLLGVAMAEEEYRLFEGTVPLDDVSSTDVDLAGRFAEYVSRLAEVVRRLAGRKPVAEWVDSLILATEMLACADPRESWQADQFRRVLDEVAAESGAHPDRPPGLPDSSGGAQSQLSIPEVRSLLGNRLKGRPTRANFRTGDLTVCTLVPMRSVPHRVVCLLGLDDGAFPRHPGRDGDDIVAADPRVGDRDPRSEDRQLLLDAVLAATDHLVVTYSGRDERTNRTRPPSVPIAELLDAIDETVRPPEGHERARDVVLVEHPLQSFDPRNFQPSSLGIGGPWGFSSVDLAGAKAVIGPKHPPRPFLAAPLPEWDASVITLDSLVGFVKSPVQWFLRERLGIYVNGSRDEVDDRLPVELTSLEEWGFGDRLLRALLDGADLEAALRVETARGLLPPQPLCEGVLESVLPVVEQLTRQAQSLPCFASEPRSVEINVGLPGGRSLVGTVAGVRDSTVVNCVYSKLAAKHRLESWVRLLAFAAGQGDPAPAAVTIGRSGTRTAARVSMSQLALDGPVGDAGMAAELLGKIVDLYERGMREPLPIYCKTSSEWAEKSRGSDDPYRYAREAWEGDRFDGEASEEAHLLVLGGRVPFNTLFDAPPRDDEQGAGWEASEKSRFGRLARRLWDDLLDHESLKVLG